MLGPDVKESVSVAEVQPVKKSMADNSAQSPNLGSSPDMNAMKPEPTTSVEDTASEDVPVSSETLEESNISQMQAETSQVNISADPNVVTEVENFVESLIKTVQEELKVENKDALIESLVEKVGEIDAPEELEDNKQLAHESNEGPEMENAVTEAESAHSDGVTVDEKPLPEEGNLIEVSEPEVALDSAVVDSAIDRADSSVEPVQAVQEGFNPADIAKSGINNTQETNLSLLNSLTTQTEEDGVISSPVIESNESSNVETEINSTESVLPSEPGKSEIIEVSTSESTDHQQPADDEYDMISYQDEAKALTIDTADIPKVADILADSQDEIMVDATVAEEYLLANPSPSIGTDSPVLLDVNPEDPDGPSGGSLEEQNSSKVEDDVIQAIVNPEVGIADVADKDAIVSMEESAADERADQDDQPLETETPVTEPIATENTLPSYDSVISDYVSTGADVPSKGPFEEQDNEKSEDTVAEMGDDDVVLSESQVADLEKELTDEVEQLESRLLKTTAPLEATVSQVADLEKELTEEVEQLESRLLENNTTLEATVSSSADPTIAVMENESAAEIIEQSDSITSEELAEPIRSHENPEPSVVEPAKENSAVESNGIAALKGDMVDDMPSESIDKANAFVTPEDQTTALQPDDTKLSAPADVTESSEAEATVQNSTIEDEPLVNLENAQSFASESDISTSFDTASADVDTTVYSEKQEDKDVGMEEQVQVESETVTETAFVGSEPLPETQTLTDALDNATDDQELAVSEPVDKPIVKSHLESSSVIKSNTVEQEEQELINDEEQEFETAKEPVVVETNESHESYAAEPSDILSNEQSDQERAVAEPLEIDVNVSESPVERQVIDEPQSDTVEIQTPSSLVEAVHDSEIVDEMKSDAVADVSEDINIPDAEESKLSNESQVAAESDINETEPMTEDRTIAEPATETETVDSSLAETESEDNLQMKDEEILADLREENPSFEPLEVPKLEYVLETPQPLSPFDISRDLPSLAQPVEEFVVVDAEQPDAAVEDEKPIVAVSEKVEEKEIEFETVSDVPEDSAEKTAVTENVAFNEDLADSENNTSPLSDEKDDVSDALATVERDQEELIKPEVTDSNIDSAVTAEPIKSEEPMHNLRVTSEPSNEALSHDQTPSSSSLAENLAKSFIEPGVTPLIKSSTHYTFAILLTVLFILGNLTWGWEGNFYVWFLFVVNAGLWVVCGMMMEQAGMQNTGQVGSEESKKER